MLKLTNKGKSVVRLVVQGLGNDEIAKKLEVKRGTISTHLLSVFKKLNIKNRTQLILLIASNPNIVSCDEIYNKKIKFKPSKTESVEKLKTQRLKVASMVSSLIDYVAIDFVKVELQKVLTALLP